MNNNKKTLNKAKGTSRIESEHAELNISMHIAIIYALDQRGFVPNNIVYESAAKRAGISVDQINHLEPIGVAGVKHSVFKRKVR